MRRRIAQVIALLCVCTALSATICNAKEEAAVEAAMVPSGQKLLQGSPGSIADLLTYEIHSDEGRTYAAITGIREEYQEDFSGYLGIALGVREDINVLYTPKIPIPDEINGVWVEEITADAFREIGVEVTHLPEHLRIVGERAFFNTKMYTQEITFLEEIEEIGESAFANCGISWVEFSGERSPVIRKRAFADNESLWAVYLPAADCVIGKEAFAGCKEKFYLGYKERTEDGKNLAEDYVEANGLVVLWVPVIDSLEPVVRYPEEPLVLRPEIGNFFYGENGEGDLICSMEEADDAPDYGFGAWHSFCGEWCVGEGFLDIMASSELASSDKRYAAQNLHALCGRESAWAEGVEGDGIGESITYHDQCH